VVIHAKRGDGIALFHANRAQAVRELADAFPKLAIRKLLVAIDQRDFIGVLQHSPFQAADQSFLHLVDRFLALKFERSIPSESIYPDRNRKACRSGSHRASEKLGTPELISLFLFAKVAVSNGWASDYRRVDASVPFF